MKIFALCFVLFLGMLSAQEKPRIKFVGCIEASPILLRQVKPVYPPSVKKAGIEGTVIFDALINEIGQVEALSVVQRSNALLLGAASEAVFQWEYKPIHLDGKPVRTQTIITVNFILEKNPAP